MRQIAFLATLAAIAAVAGGMKCTPTEPNRLDELPTVRMTIKGQAFELWVAESYAVQNAGLMYITAEQMAPLPDGTERGIIFVFDHSVRTPFWMKNTVISLDIVYIDKDGTVINMHTMPALDDRHNAYPPSDAYRYAIEIKANRLSELGVKPGDVLEIPAAVLKGAR